MQRTDIMKDRPARENDTLSELLGSLRTGWLQGCRKASDPRDIIFSLWGCYDLPPTLRPDYKLSTSIVFQRATLESIIETGDLRVLSLAGGLEQNRNSGLDLPSWVPDWSRPTLQMPLLLPYNKDWLVRMGGTSACRDYKHKPTASAVNGELPIRGRTVDRILYVSRLPLEKATGELRGVANVAHVADVRADSEYFGPLLTDDVDQAGIVLCIFQDSPRNVDGELNLDIYREQRAWVKQMQRTAN